MDEWQNRPGAVPPPPPMQQGPIGSRSSELPGALVLGGGVLVVVGVFLPWLTASGPFATTTASGLKIGTWGTLILGVFAIARGASMLRPETFKFSLGTPIVGGALILLLMAIRWSSLQDELRILRSLPGVTASIGIGVWAVIAGAILVVIGGVLAGSSRR